MIKKFLFFGALVSAMILCAGCAEHLSDKANYPQTKIFTLGPINEVIIDGAAHVTISNGANNIMLRGTPEDLSTCHANFSKNTLYIKAPVTTAPALTINLKVKDLHKLTVADHAYLTGTKFNASNLDIKAKDYAAVNLDGQIDIHQITQRGAGKIDITGIMSDALTIDSTDIGPIYLVGTAKNMLAKLSGGANLDARYLRAQKATVLTADSSQAHILATQSLAAYAMEKSNIYFYKRPPKLTIVTKNSGNVLKPDWIQ